MNTTARARSRMNMNMMIQWYRLSLLLAVLGSYFSSSPVTVAFVAPRILQRQLPSHHAMHPCGSSISTRSGGKPCLMSNSDEKKTVRLHERQTSLSLAIGGEGEVGDGDVDDRDGFVFGEVGSGPNWIERSFPVETTDGSKKVDPKKVDDYNLGISGISFGTGPLSQRMYEVMAQKSNLLASSSSSSAAASISTEVQRGFLMYAMDFTAKEAVRAALLENGLELVLTEDEEDEGMWGDIDSIRLLDDNEYEDETMIGGDTVMYDSWQEAIEVGGWTPGQAFSFVARQVPAKMRELTMDELLQALDPKGELRQQAQDKGMYMPDITSIRTLQDMANENVRRTEVTPREATASEKEAYAGLPDQRGYQVIQASDLLLATVNGGDETKTRKTILHVMDALVSHGCLIVDLTNVGADMEPAKTMAAMWNTVESFYQQVDALEASSSNGGESFYQQVDALEASSSNGGSNDRGGTELLNELISSGMRTVLETGSPHAKVGFASYDNGNMQFLETRWDRQGNLWPREAQSVLNTMNGNAADSNNEDSASLLKAAFDLVATVTNNIVRLAVATSTLEAAKVDVTRDTSSSWRAQAFQAAELLCNEIVDDAKPLDKNSGIESSEGNVSMSPHRLCRYSNKGQPENGMPINKKVKDSTSLKSREIFGAHTDSTFITAVPVASVSGLEVYDEDAEQWYRPELMARKHYQSQNQINERNDDGTIPWHARYLVCMPGELLQLTTRNEIMAAVHRVVATENGPSRLSAPILLRGRPGTRLDVNRYFLQDDILQRRNDSNDDEDNNDEDNYSLLEKCNGMTIEQIHDAMQPTSFQ